MTGLSSTDLQSIRERHAVLPCRGGSSDIAALLAHIDAYDEALRILSQSTVHSMSDLRFAATMLAEAIAETAKIDAERLAALEAENLDLRREIANGITRWDESERIEYGVLRPASMPDMSGKPTWTQIVSTTFRSLEAARTAQKNVPALRDREAVIMQRRAPGPWIPVEEDQG